MNMSGSDVITPDDNNRHGCTKDALTDSLGWFLQVLLAGLAFTCLICK